MKNSGFKYQIEQELRKRNWDVIEINSDTEWWDDENWKIVFKYDSNIFFFIYFIVDPHFEDVRKKGQGIYEVKASSIIPTNWNDDSNKIASICLTKGKFDIKLKEFIQDIEAFKKEKASPIK